MVYTIEEIKKCIEPIAKKYKLKAVYLFGSYARGEATDTSNVDIMIDRADSVIKGGFDTGGLYEDLSSYLGKEVGLITLQTLEQNNTIESSPIFIKSVRSEMIKIYGDDMEIATDYEKAVALWREKNITNGAELSAALNGHSIAFAYNSGKIENNNITYYDTREIFERDGVTSYTGDLRTLFEIRNAKEASEFFLTAYDERRPFDEEFIKELHKILTQNTYDTRRYQLGERPGEYKKNDYVTGKSEVGALPEDVPEEMAELLADMQEVKPENALTAAAFFHAKFENIHPFADGNGRTGRLAMNYFLALHLHPPIIIHEEDRKAYYAALEAWDEELELEPLKNFLMEQTVKTWTKQIQRYKI